MNFGDLEIIVCEILLSAIDAQGQKVVLTHPGNVLGKTIRVTSKHDEVCYYTINGVYVDTEDEPEVYINHTGGHDTFKSVKLTPNDRCILW